jgi:lipoprotein-anchoring transpeptidase ErfK/SrfK
MDDYAEGAGCMKRWVVSLIAIIAVAAAALLVPIAMVGAEPPAAVYFPQTGHNVGAPFLGYWRTHGGLAVYGYPLTEAMQEVSPYDNKTYTVQYFERARLEAHPENKAPYDVLLGQLGRSAAARIVGNKAFDPTAQPATVDDTHAYFPESKHTLTGDFLQYWQDNGGLMQFGFPISEPFLEQSATDGKIYTVQYFERNRFEAHPENKAPYNVLLGQLGRDLVTQKRISTAAAPRANDAPDYADNLFFTPTPTATSTPVATNTPTPAPATATPEPQLSNPRPDLGEYYIEVNLTQQHLWAYQDGQVVFDIITSTGKPGFDTPTGDFYVNQMLETQDMTGGHAGDENYYYTPDVPWIMYFDWNGDAIHGNYWIGDDAFGAPHSHGCVGVPVWAAKWLYNWGFIGLPVWVHY